MSIISSLKQVLNGQNFTKYSTEEQVVGTWIDGKPLYQKVFPNVTLNPIPSGQTYSQTTITSLSGMNVVKYDTYCDSNPADTAHGEYAKMFYASVDYSVSIKARVLKDENRFEVVAKGSQMESYKVTVILQYTKTTD